MVDGHAIDLITQTRSSLMDLNAGADTSPTSLVVSFAAQIFGFSSSIEMWILRHTRRLVPRCLRVRHCARTNGAPMAYDTRSSSGSYRSQRYCAWKSMG